MGEVLRVLNENQMDITDFNLKPEMLATLLGMIDEGTISGSMAKTVFNEIMATGKDPKTIVEIKGLTQLSDKAELEKIACEIIKSYPSEVSKYKEGKTQLLGFFVGQVMKATKGKANPKEANSIIKDLLS